MYSKSVNLNNRLVKTDITRARPFLKWVGGKGRVISQLDAVFPEQLRRQQITTYIEPFVGGGAVLFHALHEYSSLKKIVLADNNPDLILAYWTVREHLHALLPKLEALELKYLKLSESRREAFYYKVRSDFNKNAFTPNPSKFCEEWLNRTAQLIFLNKTGFNGLFRVNSSGQFNVSFGKYENPSICDVNNLTQSSQALQKAEILLGDFEQVLEHADANSFVYLDPPYRPISKTSNFTGYSAGTFTSDDQIRLSNFCRKLHFRGAKFAMSNSDSTSLEPADDYLHRLYADYRIEKISANRVINCRADRRGKVSELLIMNYGK